MIRGWEWCGTSTRDTRRRLRSRRRPASKFPCHNTYVLADSLLITGASQLLTLRGRGPRRGSSLSNLGGIEDAALKQFAAYGTTTVEAKSGYGLDVTSELKILRLHKELAAEEPLEIVSTFLGAHVVPAEYRGKTGGAERYIQLIEQNLLPEIGERKLAEFCDVFCDRGAFSVAQSKRVLQSGCLLGLGPQLDTQ